MRLGLSELFLLFVIALVAVGPTVALWLNRWNRRAQKSSRAAARRRAARAAARRAETEAILRRFQIASSLFLGAAALALLYALVLRPLDISPRRYTLPAAADGAAVGYEALTPAAAETGLGLGSYGTPACVRARDGWLYLAAETRSGSELIRMHEDGSGLSTVLTVDGALTGFDFAPDGSLWFTAVRDGHGTLSRATYDSWGAAAEAVVTQLDGAALPCLSAVAAAPDGKIYFADAAALPSQKGLDAALRTELLAHTASGCVYVYDPAARTVEQVMHGVSWAAGLALAPDGSRLYVADLASRCIWVTDTDARERPCTFVFAADLPGYPAGLDCAADGSLGVSFAFAPADWLEARTQKTFLRGVALRLPLRTQARLFDPADPLPLCALVLAPDGSARAAYAAPDCGGAAALCRTERRVYLAAAASGQRLMYAPT